MVDFLLLYESKSRELENSALLAAELEYRGHSIKIENIDSLKKYFTKARVVIVPHLYDENQLVLFCKNFWKSNNKIISLQYEQIHRKTQCNGYLEPKGQAIYAHHLAWGEAQEEQYLNRGVPASHITKTGHIAMDLMKPDFDPLFFSRDEIAKQYNLDSSKKWILFVSTFSHKLKTEEEKKQYATIDSGAAIQINNSIRAQTTILKWLNSLTRERDVIVIYRKHPAERIDKDIIELEKLNSSRFRYIDDYSMRQWVRVCDRMYTWYSTSIADAYYGKRRCEIIRPEPLPEELELSLMINARFIHNYNEFIKDIDSEEYEFPIKKETMDYYYGIPLDKTDEYAFINVANISEKILNNDNYSHTFDYGSSRFNISNQKGLRRIIGSYLYGLMYEISKIIDVPVPIKLQRKKYFKSLMRYKKNALGFKKAFNERKKDFANVLENIHARIKNDIGLKR